jgi:hypothetical protein
MKKLIVIILLVSGCTEDSRHILIKPECDYILPEGHELVYSEKENKYAIALTGYFKGQYLCYDMNDIFHNNKGELFSDSCKAKAFSHAVMLQDYPITDFKPVK